jgi:predicted nucleic acid-binding protein
VIVVDSSVWISHFRDIVTTQVEALREITSDTIIAGDIIVLEVLRGLATEEQALRFQRKFETYGITSMIDPRLALIATAHYRALRRLGITVRTLADVIIATYCIEFGHQLLHQDRNFSHFERHLGLQVLH